MMQTKTFSVASFDLEEVLAFVEEIFAQEDKAMRSLLRLVIEELVVNIVRYGFPGEEQGMFSLECLRGTGISLVVSDNGIAFDPTSWEKNAWDEERVGGHGLCLVRGVIDRWLYRREGAFNVLRVEIQNVP